MRAWAGVEDGETCAENERRGRRSNNDDGKIAWSAILRTRSHMSTRLSPFSARIQPQTLGCVRGNGQESVKTKRLRELENSPAPSKRSRETTSVPGHVVDKPLVCMGYFRSGDCYSWSHNSQDRLFFHFRSQLPLLAEAMDAQAAAHVSP